MTKLRRYSLASLASLAVATGWTAPAQAFWGGYRDDGYGGYRPYNVGPAFDAGPVVGGYYGEPYRRYRAFSPPYYAQPPVVYAPPPYYAPPAIYLGPRPRPRAITHRTHATRPAAQCRSLPPMPSSVPAPLRDVPSPGP